MLKNYFELANKKASSSAHWDEDAPYRKNFGFFFGRLFSLQYFTFNRANRMPYLNAPSV